MNTWDAIVQEGLSELLSGIVALKGVDAEHVGKTPERYVKALKEFFSGVDAKPEVALNTLFKANNYQEMIHVKEITFFSMCAHHLVPFMGKMSFAYIPDNHIVGLSKIPRLVEVYARRPQVQEALTTDIVDAFQRIVEPKGCALMVRAYHMCCMSRGIKQPTSYTETTALRGCFTTYEVKSEWLMSANASNWRIF